VARLHLAIEAADFWVLHETDPQALLLRGGCAIGPARQILFFHPRFMVRLLAADPAALLEAPLKFGVIELSAGNVMLRWADPAAAFARYGNRALVCTLCSCYPRPVLGLPPDWYKLKPYRARAVSEPRAVLAEFGTILPNDVEVRVSDSTAMIRYLVLPMRPKGTEHYSEEQLAALVTRDTMIGVVPARIESARTPS